MFSGYAMVTSLYSKNELIFSWFIKISEKHTHTYVPAYTNWECCSWEGICSHLLSTGSACSIADISWCRTIYSITSTMYNLNFLYAVALLASLSVFIFPGVSTTIPRHAKNIQKLYWGRALQKPYQPHQSAQSSRWRKASALWDVTSICHQHPPTN